MKKNRRRKNQQNRYVSVERKHSSADKHVDVSDSKCVDCLDTYLSDKEELPNEYFCKCACKNFQVKTDIIKSKNISMDQDFEFKETEEKKLGIIEEESRKKGQHHTKSSTKEYKPSLQYQDICYEQNSVSYGSKMHGAVPKSSNVKVYPQHSQVSKANARKYPSSPIINSGIEFSGNFNMYNKAKVFYTAFKEWENEREDTIQKLKKLLSDVHDDQLQFNTAKSVCKHVNYHSRRAKDAVVPKTIDFLASFAVLVSDALDGITSAAQAFSIDDYQNTFQEIIEHDAKISKSFYEARACCIKEYEDIEEIIRSVRINTFSSTIQKVSDILDIEQFWMDTKQSKQENSVANIPIALDHFIQRNSNTETVIKVCNTFQSYTEDNPATLEACKSAGIVVCDIIDTLKRDQKNDVTRQISNIVNRKFMAECRVEMESLKCLIENEEQPQAKLECDIQITIEALQSELAEFKSMAYNVLKSSFYDNCTNSKYYDN